MKRLLATSRTFCTAPSPKTSQKNMKRLLGLIAIAFVLLSIPSISAAQTIRDRNGSQIGSIQNDGTIRDKGGAQTGKINSDGVVRNKYGSQIGKIDNDGTIRDKNGSQIGNAKDVAVTWAGLYFFFNLEAK